MGRHPHWIVRVVEALAMLPVTAWSVWAVAELTVALGWEEWSFQLLLLPVVLITTTPLIVFWMLWAVGDRSHWPYGDRTLVTVAAVWGCGVTLLMSLVNEMPLHSQPDRRIQVVFALALAVGLHRLVCFMRWARRTPVSVEAGPPPAWTRGLPWPGALAVLIGAAGRAWLGTGATIMVSGALILLVGFACRCACRLNPLALREASGGIR